jgi:hypothetical protein
MAFIIMLYISTNLSKFQEFSEHFQKTHENEKFIDLSKVSLSDLANECDSVFSHHKDCTIFLGYLEPGWMLDSPSQTRLRKLIRKFPVAMVCYFLESLPFSWKNEIDILYLKDHQNGSSTTIDNGSSLRNKSQI